MSTAALRHPPAEAPQPLPEPRILIVDDEPDLRDSIGAYLARHGFTVSEADGGAALRTLIARERFDLVLLDVHMPGDDGLTLARELRADSGIGIIMLTAAHETVDRIVGLEIGADDYVAKPFDPRELLARIRAVLRRVTPAAAATGGKAGRVPFGACMLDLGARKLLGGDGREVPVTAIEYDLLKLFADRPNQPVSRDELAALTHKGALSPFDRSIDMRIGRLRRKIEVDPRVPQTIKTVRSAGYVFVPHG